MSASPLAFLRGAAPLFYEMLAADPELASGPAGEGVIQGDAHLENFGAFSPALEEAGTWRKGHATFQLNDFDEATRGAWRWDVLRLTTSLLLAGRELGQSGPAVLGLCEGLLESHSAALFSQARLPPVPPAVAALIAKVDGRSNRRLLEDRTVASGAARHFLRGERYADVSPEVAAAVPATLQTFAERTARRDGPRPEQLELLDVAFRIAGTGSLGSLRVAALTRGKGGEDTGWLFDLKEQAGSSVDVLAPRPAVASRADEVESAFRTCVEQPPRMLGTSRLGVTDVLVRRLTPQEDKLSLSRLQPGQLPELSRYLGALLGAAHRRGRSTDFPAWTPRQRGGILERAVTLAGIHEAVYLDLCLLARGERPEPQAPATRG
ncbi:MAG: hypothetical protein K0R38_1444 [Polyangiaceae bacterium]|jgi:uncharacterized protein (DUF2252 family)|nr:hypothetical protein [Polyangiaceae bacterium]